MFGVIGTAICIGLGIAFGSILVTALTIWALTNKKLMKYISGRINEAFTELTEEAEQLW